MFFASLFIAIGLAILLNTFGILNGTFWGLFWAIFFLAIGIKMLRRGNCPMCGWGKMKGDCCGCSHEHEDHH